MLLCVKSNCKAFSCYSLTQERLKADWFSPIIAKDVAWTVSFSIWMVHLL